MEAVSGSLTAPASGDDGGQQQDDPMKGLEQSMQQVMQIVGSIIEAVMQCEGAGVAGRRPVRAS
jgi:hypothetical protein